MLCRSSFCLYLFFALAGGLSGQTADFLPPGTVGVPYSLDLTSGFNDIPQPPGISITLTLTLGGGSLPPGLTLQGSGVIAGTPTAPGAFNFTLNFNLHGEADGQVFDFSVPVPVTMQINAGSGPPVSIDSASLTFPFTQGTKTPASNTIGISNRGLSPQTFTATATTNSGGQWLSVSPGAGAIAPGGNVAVQAVVDPSALAPGTYRGTIAIAISPSGQIANVPVVTTVSGGSRQIQLSSSGLRFSTVANGGTPPSQSIVVLNGGSGSLPFSASASTTSGGSWLSVSPGAGSVDAGSGVAVTVSVNPTGLQAGDYYGQIQFSSPNVDNSPQTATVVLNVAGAGTDIGPSVFPTGAIFVGAASGANPAAKTIQVTNLSPSPLTFNAVLAFDQGKTFFSAQPASGSVSASSPAKIAIQINSAGLAAGIYTGDLSLHFSDNITRHVFVLLVLVPAGSTTGLDARAAADAPSASCSPTKLIPVFTQLGQGFSTVAAWPTPVEATIVDDCGNLLTSGNVVASFSSGDPPLTLVSLRDGRWSGTWQPRLAASQVVITVTAQETSPPVQGTSSIGGSLQGNPSTPVIFAGGAVSAASFSAQQPLAPGSFVSIFGAHLGAGTNISTKLPLATQLGATQAILGGRTLPLQFAVDGQINAIIPYDVSPNTTQQLVVSNGPAISVPESVVLAPAQPAVFTKDLTGRGPGIVVAAKADGTQFMVDSDHPASAGDVLVIYCAGLGAVDPAVPAGSATPLSPLSNTVNPVTASIGGKPATVFFAGLTPGFAGLYQVNAVVPPDVMPGGAVPLVLSVAGQDSPSVTVAIR